MTASTLYSFIDVDMSFYKHPGSGDVLKKYDSEATKQAIRNMFFANAFDKPFDPGFGLAIQNWLFEQNMASSGILSNVLRRSIIEMINRYEPRVQVDQLVVDVPSDSNDMNITLQYHTIMSPIQDTVSFTFRRAR